MLISKLRESGCILQTDKDSTHVDFKMTRVDFKTLTGNKRDCKATDRVSMYRVRILHLQLFEKDLVEICADQAAIDGCQKCVD